MKLKTKSCLSYFGSDSEVAERLAAMLDGCLHVTIPFCGGLSILPHLSARAVVANDLNGLAINFYRVLAGDVGEPSQRRLMRRCQNTLSHPEELALAADFITGGSGLWRKAWAYWAICWIGRKGAGGCRGEVRLPSVRRTAVGGSNATRIQAAAGDLETWANHFRRCEFEQVCFRELLPKVADQEGVGIYVDAPWVVGGKNYMHAFNEQDHYDLAASLGRFQKATVVIRYDDAPLIRKLYPEDAWDWTETATRTQSNGSIAEAWITRNVKAVQNGNA